MRPYYGGGPLLLNTTTLQYDVDASVQIAADFDLATIDADSWGVPWDAFIYEQPLPRSWELKLNATVEAWRGWDRALLLLLPMGDNDSRRSCPSQNATDSPTGLPVLSPVGGCTRCFNYNTTTSPVAAFFRQGYVNYVLAMAAAFTLNAPSKNAPLVGVAFALDALGDGFHQFDGARMQLAAFLVQEERDRHAPVALARNAPVGAGLHHAFETGAAP